MVDALGRGGGTPILGWSGRSPTGKQARRFCLVIHKALRKDECIDVVLSAAAAHFCPLEPYCCPACSLTDSSPSTLLAAMKLGTLVSRTTQEWWNRTSYVQATMPATEPAHALGLDAGHPEEILGVSEVGGELSQLRVQLRLEDESLLVNLHECEWW